MADVDALAPGHFNWTELATGDQEGAKRFYTQALGWEAVDVPIGPDQVYTLLKLRGRDVGALYRMDENMKKQGVPPHWGVYVCVASADEGAERARRLGATIVVPPFDVMEHGRMAVITDPTGASLSLWQPRKHPGFGVINEPGAPCWFELRTRDAARARDFYGALFGWEFQVSPEYSEIVCGGTHVGGVLALTEAMGPMPPHWAPYFQVASLDDALTRAKAAGAQLFLGPNPAGDMGRFAVLGDPTGASFSLYEHRGRG